MKEMKDIIKEIVDVRFKIRGFTIIKRDEAEFKKFAYLKKKETNLIRKIKKLFQILTEALTTRKVISEIIQTYNLPATVKIEKMIQDFVNKEIKPELLETARYADEVILEKISRMRKQYTIEDLISSYMENRLSQLVSNLTFSQRVALRNLFQQYVVERAVSPFELAEKLKDVIGLTDREREAIENFRIRLISEGMPEQRIREQVRRYSERLKFERAMRIARTELNYIYNYAQLQRLNIAKAEGWLAGTVVKIWLTADDERTCPLCGEMDEERVVLNANFSNGLQAPPYHVNCRCSLAYEVIR